MTRGNQRDVDRQRAQARNAASGTKSDGNPKQRNEDNAAALAAKVEAKREREAALARGEVIVEKKKSGGIIAKKDGSKK